jgi:hypothetical protein
VTAIKIDPAGPRDLAMHSGQYDQLETALREAGYNATVERRPQEQRGVGHVAAEIAVHVGEDGVAGVIVGFLRRYLRGLRRPQTGEPRRAVIYGPTGDVLSTVELPDDDG